MNEDAIVIENLVKSYKDTQVLKGLNLRIKRGSVFGLLGPNGAGKTTTIRILSTLLEADSGLVLVNGHNVTTHADEVRHSIGLTGQYAAVDELLSGRENLVMMGRLYHLSKKDATKRAGDLLEQFDLMEAADRAAKTYSGGMRRRLDLALSLVATPPIVFLDEPTTGLDPRSRLAVWDIVEKLKASGATILLTTQYLDEADTLADRIAVIDHGIVIAEGTADELKARVGNERLEVTIATQSDFEKAARLITGDGLQIDEEERKISIATSGAVSEVKAILNLMEEHNIELDALSLHKPTLDDVFLKLTGRQTEETKQ